jgi:hypothetical protein
LYPGSDDAAPRELILSFDAHGNQITPLIQNTGQEEILFSDFESGYDNDADYVPDSSSSMQFPLLSHKQLTKDGKIAFGVT